VKLGALLFCLTLAACAKTSAPEPAKNVTTLGAPFTGAPEASLAAVVKDPASYDQKVVTVRGTIARACQKKGCWMELRPAGAESGMRVTFKDYAFFVPLDSAGASARVEGAVQFKKLEAEYAAHLEGEGAKITRNAEGEAIEIGLVASAVELSR
jgi:hypothetical protein